MHAELEIGNQKQLPISLVNHLTDRDGNILRASLNNFIKLVPLS